jgi:DNA-binding NtrC family response regulator
VLVVDEEDAVRGLVSRVLTRHGYNVIQARDRGDAIRAAGGAGAIDVAIIDCRTLDDSLALGRELTHAQPPVSLVYFAASDSDAGFAGTELRLRKPFMPDALVRVVTQALNERSTTRPSGR